MIDPWLLGSLDENDVQGLAGTPVDINPLTVDFGLPIGAAGTVFPRLKRYYVSVDSTQDIYTRKPLRGRYRLRYWVNDLRPPRIRLLTRRVAAGRPTLAARVQDAGAGVDPYSLLLAYRTSVLGAVAYDSSSGVAIFQLPSSAPRLRRGSTRAIFGASDFQEAKNITVFGPNVMPNTSYRGVRIRAVRGTTVTWLLPRGRNCVRGNQGLLVLANTTGAIRAVRFLDGRARSERRERVFPVCIPPPGGRGARSGDGTGFGPSSSRLAVAPRRLARRSRVQIAVITGGATGIGAALARRLTDRGWRCVLVGRREDRQTAAAEIDGEYEVCDVGDRGSVGRMAASVRERHPKVGLLVNNAGMPGAETSSTCLRSGSRSSSE